MDMKRCLQWVPVVVLVLLAMVATSAPGYCRPAPAERVLEGSTPCDDYTRSILLLPQGPAVDFIRWKLVLQEQREGSGSFVLHLQYGESQPNTLGFWNGGHHKMLQGSYAVQPMAASGIRTPVYRLVTSLPVTYIHLAELAPGLFHLLGADGHLLRGNGGWSFNLHQVNKPGGSGASLLPLTASAGPLPRALWSPDSILAKGPEALVLEGRSPCIEIAAAYSIPVTPQCFKMKWLIRFLVDPLTGKPSHFQMKKVGSRVSDTQGRWSVTRGLPHDPDLLLLNLEPSDGSPPITLFLADRQVAFFLDAGHRLLPGNADFSYTLNRRL